MTTASAMTPTTAQSVNFDVLENIVQFCDIDSSINLMLSSKKIYYLYQAGEMYLRKIICKKICERYGLSFLVFSEPICKELFYLHSVLKRMEDYTFGDILRCLAPRVTKGNHLLFSYCVSACDFQFWPKQHYIKFRPRYLSTRDLEYVLVHGNASAYKIVFGELFIPSGMLAQCIKTMLRSLYEKTCNDEHKLRYKIVDFINHTLAKNHMHFNAENRIYYRDILKSVVIYHQWEIMKSTLVLQRKYEIPFDYDYMINEAVKVDDLHIIKILFAENRLHMTKYPLTDIKIRPESVVRLFSCGELNSLSYILSYMIGNTINMTEYVESICHGLDVLFESKGWPQMTVTLRKTNVVSQHLTTDNRIFINKHLVLLQRRYGVPDKDIFMLINPRQQHV
jgi:hypothetical protein